MLSDHLDLTVTLGGEELRIVPGTPVPEEALQAAERALGWPLPEDYRAALLGQGAANVLGASMLTPADWTARMEPLDANPVGRMACYLPFASRPIPSGGELLFCFRFELTLAEKAVDLAAFARGEERPTFQGAPYQVVACMLPGGRGGARLEESQRPMAPTFDAWVEQIVAMVRARANAAS